MNKLVLRFREVDRDKYQAILDGSKTVETRAATKKYQKIEAGDVIVAICGKDKHEISIKKVSHFQSIEELFAVYDLRVVLPTANDINEAKNIYHSFPGYKEKIKQYGIIAFELS